MNLPTAPVIPQDMHSRLLVARLPSLPQTLLKLLALCQSDDVGMSELSGLISSDPAIAAKVLSVAHSAAYSRGTRQLNLLQAASTLGTDLIKVLVISESVFQTLSGFSRAGSADLRHFWKHSLSVALIARALAGRLGYAQSDEAYLAGLLHDVGRLALLAAVPDRYLAIFGKHDDRALCDLEQRDLGMSHAEAGAWLLSRWQMDSQIVESVRNHHADPASLSNARPLTHVVHLAHRLAALPLNAPDAVANFVCEQGLKSEEIPALLQNAAIQLTQTARDLGIDITVPDVRSDESVPAPPAPVADAAGTQLAQEVHDLTVLREMAQTLSTKRDTPAVLNSLRQHAGVLLQLADTVVMLASDDQQTVVPVSMSDRRSAAAHPPLDVSAHPSIAKCLLQRRVVYSTRKSNPDDPLLNVMGSDRVVLVPLATTRQCFGILVAVVSAELSHHVKNQGRLLQAFGVYAGMALSLRHQQEKNQQAQSASSLSEQLVGMQNKATEVRDPLAAIRSSFDVPNNQLDQLDQLDRREATQQQNSPDADQATGPVDLGSAIREIVRLLQGRQFFPAPIHISCQLPERATPVQGSLRIIKQLMLNLIKSAGDCMPNGGEIVINAGVLVQRAGDMFTNLTVSYSGTGLTQDIQAQLFEHSGIDKMGENQGLGIVNSMVEKMAGHIKFTVTASETRFDILLPCARPENMSD